MSYDGYEYAPLTRPTNLADGVVVGSALIDQIANAENDAQAVDGVLGLCKSLADGVRGARL